MLRKVSEPGWKVCVGVLLQRWPTVAPAMTDLEKQYAALQHTLEVERSLLSDHELRHRNDAKKIAEMKEEAQKQRSGRSEEQALFVTAREDEQRWQAELEELKHQFEKSSQILKGASKQDADWKSESARSTNRLLDRNLYLLVNQRFSAPSPSSSTWMLPTISWDQSLDEFYLRRTANRLLSALAADTFQLGTATQTKSGTPSKSSFEYRLLSNAPCAFTQWRFSQAARSRTNYTGVKLFVYKAHLTSGNLNSTALSSASKRDVPPSAADANANATSESTQVTDFRWCSREELSALYASSHTTLHYNKMLKPLLIQ